MHTLDSALASRFARIALSHVTREYPNKLDHVLSGPESLKGPRDLHPVFFGSFDWHSCVHGYWLLARLYRRVPEMETAREVAGQLDAQLTPQNVAGEVAYLAQPSSRGFERPYGWAWALMLCSELLRHRSTEGARWAAALTPLGAAFAERFRRFLPLATYPVRAGVHSNTAFALLLALDYAAAAQDTALSELLHATARRWYGQDQNYRGLEPSQDEFLSPTLMEAALMQAVLPRPAFQAWLAGFWPGGEAGTALLSPAEVSDRSDGKIAHLDGLNLSRAWCLARIKAALPEGHPLHAGAEAAISAHLTAALDHVAGDYMGEHWLASFALLALDPYPD